MMNKFGRELFSLGELYVSDFVDSDSNSRAGKHDMTLEIVESLS